MDDEAYERLAAFILAQVPYAPEIYLKPGFEAVAEIVIRPPAPQAGFAWEFNPQGQPARNIEVRKAIRIAYQYRNSNGVLQTTHLMIGYEGGDGGS